MKPDDDRSVAMERLLSGHPTVVEFEAGAAKLAIAMSGGAKHEALQ